MEMERKLGVLSNSHDTENHQNQQSGGSSETKVENEEMTSLSQWLQPSKFPLSYLALLNEDSTPDEKPSLDYVVKKVVVPSCDSETGPGGRTRTLYSASESDGTCSAKIGSSIVKPSICVQSRTTNSELSGSSSNFPVARRSSRKSTHPWSKNYYEESSSKIPVIGQPSRKSEQPSSQNSFEKLRSWKEQNNNYKENNRDFSQLYGKYRDIPSKKSNKYKRSYRTECERKQRIDENIKALGELLPHEAEDTPESILNDIIAHVKLLQLQMKELTRSRLGGEPISHPLISIEGYGHFIQEEQTMTKPLEEIMEDLFTNDLDDAATLLESKGLYLLPFSSVQSFF